VNNGEYKMAQIPKYNANITCYMSWGNFPTNHLTVANKNKESTTWIHDRKTQTKNPNNTKP